MAGVILGNLKEKIDVRMSKDFVFHNNISYYRRVERRLD